ncbi:MAG: hypothetical protein V3G42_15585, partial [Oscillospiraceae bacterium]
EIRYIITVNALKEGWDCPFAYILASLANKTSRVDVEQILGRILRQPYTRKHKSKLLNMSFVLSCSQNFRDTISSIIKGLKVSLILCGHGTHRSHSTKSQICVLNAGVTAMAEKSLSALK